MNSPIEVSLDARQGVCQDFSHIMIAAVRGLRIPCRYVSGYLYHDELHHDRSAEGATHAWVEALLPGLGWIGFDPTNGVITGTRHIRTAVGRDYADVPPTIGTMKGRAETELQVRVRVAPVAGAAAARRGVCRRRGVVAVCRKRRAGAPVSAGTAAAITSSQLPASRSQLPASRFPLPASRFPRLCASRLSAFGAAHHSLSLVPIARQATAGGMCNSALQVFRAGCRVV